jgi:hypothetical protein
MRHHAAKYVYWVTLEAKSATAWPIVKLFEIKDLTGLGAKVPHINRFSLD